jgi:protein-disulfide isomerase
MPAANASMCANEQGKFWEMHDKIFENNRALNDPDLEANAQALGLDMGKFKECYSANKFKNQIETDQRTAVQLGARGTPAFFINGRYLSGAQPSASFGRIIDEELKKAKDSGVSKDSYYEETVVKKGDKKL